ncbi:MAG: zinc metallopeptidase [Ahrensia sp.]|nr:zinc metallopeptidase [Ahrensia sp.]
MRWRGRRESSNIEDMRDGRSGGGGFGGSQRGGRSRRGGFRIPGGLGRGRIGRGGARRASGGGFGTIIILVILFFGLRACGIDPLEMLAGDGGLMLQQAPQTTRINPNSPMSGQQAPANDEMKQFVGVVLAETEDVWRGIFQQQGRDYPEPRLVMFTDQIRSACGFASSASGPFYCPGDSKIYLDTSFFDTLARRFDAAGDFAQAYVIAHEVGHHVQNVIGILPKFNRMRRSLSKEQENAMSVRVELQADCFAGVWAHFTDQKGLLERGDLQEALNAASQIGDDAIQKRTQGYVVPESFSHGTSQQRKAWFTRGFETGRVGDCDTKVFG